VQVTGEKIVRSQDRTLSSVAVATAADIREHGDIDLQQILDRTPGVYTQSGNENWGIRGVPVSGFDDQGPAAVNGAVSMLVDDALQANRMLTINPLQLWDVEQVEVYRGAQSTTQGRNSLAGAVVLRTHNPTFTPEFAVQVNAGKYGERGASALASGALVDDVVAGRLAIDYQSSDGYIDNVTLHKDANIARASDIRGKLLIKPSDKAELLLTVARTEHRTGDIGVAAQDGKPLYYKLLENTDAHDKIAQNTATAKFTYDIDSAWSFTSVTSGTWAKIDTLLDFDQEADTTQEAVRAHSQDLLSQELRLGYGADDLKGFFGVYYGEVKGDTDEQLVDEGSVVLADKSDVRIRNAALFGEVNWEFVDSWQLIAGLRFDHEKNSTNVRYSIDEYGLASDVDANEDKNFDVWLPKIGISHDLTENQLLGLVWQRGYRSGGVNVRATTNHQPYDPEYTKTIELSWRGNWLDNSLRTSANVYHTDWDDQQVTFLNSNGTRQVTNAAESRLQGVELSAEYRVTPQLALTAGAAYNHTEYLNFVVSGTDFSGEEFLFAPKSMASVGANYLFTSGLLIGGDLVYQGASTSGYNADDDGQVTGERRSDKAMLLNLNAEYPLFDSVLVKGYVKNVFDKRYITNNQGDTGLDVGAPLTFGVAVRYDYR
jgi:outer membrane receptor protein involved in Fe transport